MCRLPRHALVANVKEIVTETTRALIKAMRVGKQNREMSREVHSEVKDDGQTARNVAPKHREIRDLIHVFGEE